MPGNRRAFTVPHGGGINSTQLGFSAAIIMVDNPTPSYWYLPDQQATIAPFTTGIVIAGLGSQVANVEFKLPPDVNQSYVTSASYATFTYLETAIAPPNAGLGFGALVTPGNNYGTITVNNGASGQIPLPTLAAPLYVKLDSLSPGRAFLRISRIVNTGGFLSISVIDARRVAMGSLALEVPPIFRLGSYGAGYTLSADWVAFSGGNALNVEAFY